ncbi:MAG: hypothetical protein H6746_18525 [Deltaproteobacteria bacterium]|nr:hypothetical protein [Deltaproteobacteria bacterium]
MRSRPPVALTAALVLTAALLGAPARVGARTQGDGSFDPPPAAGEVEPGRPDDALEPGGRQEDVEPRPGIDQGDSDPEVVPLGEEGSDIIPRQDALPPEGRADRPSLPRVGVDVLYPGAGVVGQGTAMISLNEAGEDLYLFLNMRAVFVGRNWAFGPRLPLRLRLVDHAPRTASVIRKEDWDEISDFARLLAFFQVGHPGEPYFLRFGELPGVTIGHGTMVNRYFNTIDIDHYQGGIYAYVDPGIIGAELLLDNVFDPDIFAVRAFLRPMNPLRGLPYALRKLKIAVTAGGDFQAPTEVAHDADGGILTDDDFHPRILSTSAMPFFGLDLELPLVSRPHADFVPYVDLNSIDVQGAGVHIGAYLTFRFDALKEWRLRLEYRYSGSHYEPDYINPFYEIQRVSYRRDGRTKLAWLRDGGPGVGRSGFYGETEFRWSGMMNYTLVFANDQGPDNTDLMMKLELPHLGPIRLGLFFARLDFDGIRDFFGANDTVFAASIRYNFLDRFYVRFRLVNDWWLEHTESGSSQYRTKTDFDFGFGLIIRL